MNTTKANTMGDNPLEAIELTIHRRNDRTVKKVSAESLSIWRKAIGLPLLTLFILTFFQPIERITDYYHTRFNVRPMMEKLADEGKDQAALWLVQNYYSEESDRVPALAAKGYPEAQFMHGYVMFKSDNVEAGLRLIEQAADAGYLPAIEFIVKQEQLKADQQWNRLNQWLSAAVYLVGFFGIWYWGVRLCKALGSPKKESDV